MESVEEFPASNPSELSDWDLIRRYCEHRQNQETADELWRRFSGVIYESLKRHARYIRPNTCDYRTFLDSCYSRAYLNFFNRICGFRFEGSIQGWLHCLAGTTARDECRFILRVRTQPGVDETGRQHPGADTRTIPLEEAFPDTNPADVTFKSKHYRLHPQLSTDVVEKIRGQERKFIVRELLIVHAAESEQGAESSLAIRLHHWRSLSKADIARYRCGEAANPKEQNTREAQIGRELRRDYQALRLLLRNLFGISSFSEI